MRFTDRTVLVAGGAGALGRAVCGAFLAEGARVMAAGRRAEELAALAAAAGAPERLVLVQSDLTDPAQAARAVGAAVRAGGRLDAVVNAVGAWAGGAPLWDEPADLLDRMLALNLRAGHALARAAIPVLRRGGAFVEIASAAAEGPQPGQATYAAVKAAARSLFLSLAEEVRGRGVRVNVVSPGTMDTEANRNAMPAADRSGWVAVDAVARAVLWLCSDDASGVSGAVVPLRGGGAA